MCLQNFLIVCAGHTPPSHKGDGVDQHFTSLASPLHSPPRLLVMLSAARIDGCHCTWPRYSAWPPPATQHALCHRCVHLDQHTQTCERFADRIMSAFRTPPPHLSHGQHAQLAGHGSSTRECKTRLHACVSKSAVGTCTRVAACTSRIALHARRHPTLCLITLLHHTPAVFVHPPSHPPHTHTHTHTRAHFDLGCFHTVHRLAE